MSGVTPLELAILRALWRRGKATVKEVRADLAPSRKLAYTTVMTVMDRLFRKGLARRTRRSRAHVYEPAVLEGRLRTDAVAALVETWFAGSPEALRSFLETGHFGEPHQSETGADPGPREPAEPASLSAPSPPGPRETIDDSLL